jgi:hypothetical protein
VKEYANTIVTLHAFAVLMLAEQYPSNLTLSFISDLAAPFWPLVLVSP